MAHQLMTTFSEQEFKEFLKDALKELLGEKLGATQEQQPDILDARQAAKFLKLQVTTLYEKTSRRLIPHFKKGNKVYFHLAALRDWIMQGKVKTRDEIESEAVNFTLSRKGA